jgi:putative tricarboxylic transport membrane protein
VRVGRPVLLSLSISACSIAQAAAQPSAVPIDHLVLVAPAAPGGGWDQTARALQHVIDSRRLARVVEVQNVPGAAGTIGLSQFVESRRGRGDALLVTGLVMLGATLWNDSPVSIDQATPIARLTEEYEVVAVPAASPLRDLRALLAEFRRRPEAFAWGGGSAGGTDHILAGLLAEAAAVDPRRINYVAFSGGGEAVAALLGGHIAAGISGYSEFAPHFASGRLRALAVSSFARLPGIDVPTIRESGFDVVFANWRGLLAPSRY